MKLFNAVRCFALYMLLLSGQFYPTYTSCHERCVESKEILLLRNDLASICFVIITSDNIKFGACKLQTLII